MATCSQENMRSHDCPSWCRARVQIYANATGTKLNAFYPGVIEQLNPLFFQ